MTKLVLSPANSQLLRRIAEESSTDDALTKSLKAALLEQPNPAKMTPSSPAVPIEAPTSSSPEPLVLEHTLLISLTSHSTEAGHPDAALLKLSSLVKGSKVYTPPKPVFVRSKQLEDSLAAIRLAQEQAEYSRMSTSGPSQPAGGYKIPSSYVNISGVDPTLTLSQRISSQHNNVQSTTAANNKLVAHGEEQAWADAQRQLSVILNIFLSTLATATAAWWASGNATAGHKVMVSMLVAILTAVAEVVLYNRYYAYVNQSKAIKKGRMRGSDVKNVQDGPEGFKPLQLGSSSLRSSDESQRQAPKGPS